MKLYEQSSTPLLNVQGMLQKSSDCPSENIYFYWHEFKIKRAMIVDCFVIIVSFFGHHHVIILSNEVIIMYVNHFWGSLIFMI